MKKVIAWLQNLSFVGAMSLIIAVVALAAGSDYFYTLTINTKVVMKSGAYQTFTSGYQNFWGTSYIDAGDSTTLKFGNAIAKKDSFTVRNYAGTADSSTSLTLDTVRMLGARSGDLCIVQKFNPAYSATLDTGATEYHARVLNNDSVLVTRAKAAAASTLKQGGLFDLFVISKQ